MGQGCAQSPGNLWSQSLPTGDGAGCTSPDRDQHGSDLVELWNGLLKSFQTGSDRSVYCSRVQRIKSCCSQPSSFREKFVEDEMHAFEICFLRPGHCTSKHVPRGGERKRDRFCARFPPKRVPVTAHSAAEHWCTRNWNVTCADCAGADWRPGRDLRVDIF